MSRKMISPDGIKANMVCASCEHCKLIRSPSPTLWRNKCIKSGKWLSNTSGYCDDYEPSQFFVKERYKEIQ